VIEAQASGLPVVGVNAGALRERVLDGLGALGPVDDPEAMAANIVRMAQDRARIAPRARAHIVENFSWSRALARLLASYEARQPPDAFPQRVSRAPAARADAPVE
jgi:alpha-1,6-mannosyltransferase